MKILTVALALMLVVPVLLGGEDKAAPRQILIEAKILRGTIFKTGALSGGDAALPRVIEELKKANDRAVVCAPSVVCESGHLATITAEGDRVFTDLAGEQEIHTGTRLEFRPVVSADGKSVALDLDARITEAAGDSGFHQLRRRAKVKLVPGETVMVRLGSVPEGKALEAEDARLLLLLTVYPVD